MAVLHDEIAEFLRAPAGAAFERLRQAVIGAPDYRFYDGALRALEPMASGQPPEAPQAFLDQLPACMPGFLLTPRLHLLAARCARALGDEVRARYEVHFARSCLAGMLAAGTGDAEAPYPVTHVEDAYDLLDRLSTPAVAWQRRVGGAGILDCATLADGRSIHFDISPSSALSFDGRAGAAPG